MSTSPYIWEMMFDVTHLVDKMMKSLCIWDMMCDVTHLEDKIIKSQCIWDMLYGTCCMT